MNKIIFIFIIFSSNQIFAVCNSCKKNKQYLIKTVANINQTTQPTNGPKTNITGKPNFLRPKSTNTMSVVNALLRPKFNVKPTIEPTNLLNATAVTFGSSSQALLTTTTSNGLTYLIGTSNANGNSLDFAVARYNNAGNLDNSFGTRGVVLTDILPIISNSGATGSTDIPTAFALQTNGAILVAGKSNAGSTANTTFSKSNFVIARYLTTGKLDPSFGTSGVVLTDIGLLLLGSPGGSTDEIVTMSLQSTGRIIVAGNSNANLFGLNNSFAVARYTSTGDLDSSFAQGNGVVVFSFSALLNSSTTTASTDILTGMNVLSTGKIILTGFSNAQNPNFDFAALRLNSNGTLDTTFGTKGFILTSIPTSTT